MAEECENLIEKKSRNDQEAMETAFQKLVIINEDKKKQVPCHYPEFFESLREQGWCLTCVDNTTLGQPGHCGRRITWVSGEEKEDLGSNAK